MMSQSHPNSSVLGNVLFADDQEDIHLAGRYLLEPEGYQVFSATTPSGVLAVLQEEAIDALVMDLNYTRDTTSGHEGLDLLSEIKKQAPDLPIMVMTAWGTIENAVEAMRRGANDFIQKPWQNERLLSWVQTQCKLVASLRRSEILAEENRLLREEHQLGSVVGDSPAMARVSEVIRHIAPSDIAVLITGENGTGKSLFAQWIHRLSLRRDEALISVNMGALPEHLFESELFGHMKGAFTDAKTDRIGRVELADKGTLFLDEIGNCPLDQQAKLLRFLETGEYERIGSSKTRRADVRVIAATNADLKALIEEGRFREDLYYRLAMMPVDIPPLRDRVEDIDALARHFLDIYTKKYQKHCQLSPDALSGMRAYSWRGNVRELRHCVERSVFLAQDGSIGKDALGICSDSSRTLSLDDMSLEEVEVYLIRRTLQQEEGNVSATAKKLGMSRATLYRRLKNLNL